MSCRLRARLQQCNDTAMTDPDQPGHAGAFGFPSRVPLERAEAWLDAHARQRRTERIDVARAAGRVLAEPVVADTDLPPADCAAAEGYALRAAESEGASAYNPVPLVLTDRNAPELPPGAARAIAADEDLPAGADAILPPENAQPAGAGMLDVLEPVAVGEGVRRRGSDLRAGAEVLPAGRRLRPLDLALLVVIGSRSAPVISRPRIRLIACGAGAAAMLPMLATLIARDGGLAEEVREADALATAAKDSDLVLLVGGTGAGPRDRAPAALAAAGGTVDLFGIALRPGGASGLGRVGAVPVILLPDTAPDCLAAYDMLAGAVIRRMAGLDPALPYPVLTAPLLRKIVSVLGFTDLAPVRVSGEAVLPAGSPDGAGIGTAAQADGFVVVPPESEGFPPSAHVTVHLYEPG